MFSTHGRMGLAYAMASCNLTRPYTALFRHDVSFHPATLMTRMSTYILREWVPGVFSANMATCDMTSCELTRPYTALSRFEPMFASKRTPTLKQGHKSKRNHQTACFRDFGLVHIFTTHDHMALTCSMVSCDKTRPRKALFGPKVRFDATPTTRCI